MLQHISFSLKLYVHSVLTFRISDYILVNFISNDSGYPLNIWIETTSNVPRTTNYPESYHRRLKDQFYNSHPSFHNFFEKQQAEMYIKIHSN